MAVNFIPALLERGTCAALIAEAERMGFARMATLYPDGYRNNDRLIWDSRGLAADLFRPLQRALPNTLHRRGRMYRLVGLNDRFRVCRYQDGQAFAKHRDGAHVRSNGERSFLTCQVYLNEGFDGGHTRFYSGNVVSHSIAPVTGHAIVFDHDHWHDGEAVTRGTKYVLRTDAMYAPITPAEDPLADAGYFWRVLALDGYRVALTSRDGHLRIAALHQGQLKMLEDRRMADSSLLAIAQTTQGLVLGTRKGELILGERTVQAHTGAVLDLLSLPDGTFASASADGCVAVWTTAGTLVERRQFGAWQTALAFDGALISAGLDGIIHKWDGADTQTTEPITALALPEVGHGKITSLLNTPHGVLSTSEDGRVALAGRVIAEHTDFARSAAILGDYVVSAGYDGALVNKIAR